MNLTLINFWLLNSYIGIKKKNDGLQPKYRIGFDYIYIREMNRKIMRLAEVQICILLNVYKGNRKEMMAMSQSTDLDLPIYV